MVCILTNENVSKQLRGDDALVNDLLGCSRLMNDVTLTAYPFWIEKQEFGSAGLFMAAGNMPV